MLTSYLFSMTSREMSWALLSQNVPVVDTQEVVSYLETWSSGFDVGDVTRWRLVDCLRKHILDKPS